MLEMIQFRHKDATENVNLSRDDSGKFEPILLQTVYD
jgi:hypothetical protein